MKHDFDTRKNMSTFAYFTAEIDSKIDKIIDKINDLLFMRKIAKNWIDVALFRIGLKKTLTIQFRDGKTVHFKNREEYFDFWNQELVQNELLKTVKNIHYKIKGNNIELEYQNKKIYFYLSNIISFINENFIKEQY